MKVNDKKIVHYIKFLPFYFLITTTIIFILYILIENRYSLQNEKKSLETQLISSYKEKIKDETLKVVNYIDEQLKNNEYNLINELKEKDLTAIQIISNIYEINKDKSREEILEKVRTALEKIRFFNDRGYYYILDSTGYCHFHPVFKQLQGRSLLEIQDVKGTYLTKEMIKIMENNQTGYLNYYWYKPNDTKKQYEKIAYLHKFEPLDIFVISSDYLDSLTKKWQNNVISFLKSIDFKDNSHYFIINKKTGNYVFHKQKEFEGKHITEVNYVVDGNGFLNDIKKDKSNNYYTYEVKNPDGQITIKDSYVQVIEEWDWIIGIGYHKEDIDEIINIKGELLEEINYDNLIQTLVFMLFVSILVLLISKYFSKIIERRFKVYNFSINRKIVEIARQQRVLAQQSKMVAMGEMIENIAHQWRQPLSIISTCSTGLKLNKDYGNLTDELFYSNLKSINDSAQYLSQTIDDFRNYYQKSNDEKSFRIDELIEKSLQLLKIEIDKLDIDIQKELKKVQLIGYENELLQVILNILNNSIYQFKTLEDLDKYILRINIHKNDDYITLNFIDNGGGIDPEIIDRIFEPYFTTKDKNMGTGIGLYMSKNIVEKHFNGTMNAKNIVINEENNNYKGVKFSIKIQQK